MMALEGTIALVTGATRGAGRGIAVELGAAGATVYCTGRSVRGRTTGRPETIEDTAELVTQHGGTGIPVRCDHTVESEVVALFERITNDQHGRLDLLINDIWGGDELTEWGKPFWEHDLQKGFLMLDRAVRSHIITSRYAVPLMVARRQGLVVEVTDGDTLSYRGDLFYDLAKTSVIRLAYAMAEELRPHGIPAIAITPGFLRSEAVLDSFGVKDENWHDVVETEEGRKWGFGGSETPRYIGRAVVALASDPKVSEKAGKVWATWTLKDEYGFTDVDGSQPDWGRYFKEHLAERGEPSGTE